MWFVSKLAHLELVHYFSVRPNETRLEQKQIKSVRACYARHSAAKTFNSKAYHIGMILFARVNSATLFSAKVNHLTKCSFLQKYSTKKTKTRDCSNTCHRMPCCNSTVNIGFLAAHEDRNIVKLQSRFLRFATDRDEPLLNWTEWTELNFIKHLESKNAE